MLPLRMDGVEFDWNTVERVIFMGRKTVVRFFEGYEIILGVPKDQFVREILLRVPTGWAAQTGYKPLILGSVK